MGASIWAFSVSFNFPQRVFASENHHQEEQSVAQSEDLFAEEINTQEKAFFLNLQISPATLSLLFL